MNQNAVKAFPILQNLNGSVAAKDIKIHLASTNEGNGQVFLDRKF